MKNSLIKYSNKKDIILQSAWNMLSNNSQQSYQGDLNLFFDFVKKDLPKIDQKDIIDFIIFLQKKGYKNSTINRKIASISKLFTVYVIAGVLPINPVDIARKFSKLNFKIIKSNRSYLTLQNIKDCLKARHKNQSDNDIYFIIKFLAKTGLRISELLNIKLEDIQDINIKIQKIRISGKGRKERFITIEKKFTNEIFNHFKDRKNNQKNFLFWSPTGKKYNRSWVYSVLKKRFKESINMNVTPHMLRHFYATYKIVHEKKI